MAREKKVSVKYFLNRRLKPQTPSNGKYPVYVRVTFNRKQTSIKLPIPGLETLYWNESDLETFLKRKETGNLGSQEVRVIKQEKIIEDILKKRYQKYKDEFTFEKLGEELEYYSEKVLAILYKATYSLLDSELKVSLPPEQYDVVKRANLVDKYFAATALFIGLKTQLSESLITLIQAFASFSAFDSFRLKATTVYAWFNEGDKSEYAQFIVQLTSNTELVNKIRDKSQVDNQMRLLLNFIEELPAHTTMIDMIDNQIIASKP